MAEETTMIASALGADPGVQRRTGRVMLAVLCGEITGRVFSVTGRESIIGRGDTAEVSIPGGDISRKHAKVILDVDGIAKVVDLKSTNGTFVNERRVEVEVLREGDRVRIGKTTTVDVRYEYFEPPSASAKSSRLGAAQNSGEFHNVAEAMDNVGRIPNTKKDYQQILDSYRHTLAIRQQRLGESHPSVAAILDGIGRVFQAQMLHDDALDSFHQALHIYEGNQDQTPAPEMAHTLVNIGISKIGKKSHKQSIAALQRAISMLEARMAGPVELAPSRFALAQAQFELGKKSEAIALAEEARNGFSTGDKRARSMVVEVDVWLAKVAS